MEFAGECVRFMTPLLRLFHVGLNMAQQDGLAHDRCREHKGAEEKNVEKPGDLHGVVMAWRPSSGRPRDRGESAASLLAVMADS